MTQTDLDLQEAIDYLAGLECKTCGGRKELLLSRLPEYMDCPDCTEYPGLDPRFDSLRVKCEMSRPHNGPCTGYYPIEAEEYDWRDTPWATLILALAKSEGWTG